MVKVTYIGGFSEIRIRVGAATFDKWKKGETRDIGEVESKVLLKNKDFSSGESKVFEEKKEIVKEESDINFDLNNDGKIDKKDRSIAAKVLRSGRK